MNVTAWNNGSHHSTGAGYGFKVEVKDRDVHFQRAWQMAFVVLPGTARKVEVDVAKPSFWSDTCRELISREFGRWLIDNGYAPWPKGEPPKFRLLHTTGNEFRLEKS